MKISGIGGNRGPSGTRRAERTSRGDQAFGKMVDRPAGSAQASATGGIGSLGALLAVQEVPDASEERRRARERGTALLDQLEQIRIALLSGRLPRTVLEQLSAMVAARRGQVSDPQLSAILDEIELRAAVELAKYDSLG